MTELEKQFAGNYVRLVNKSRSLEQDVILKDKMIELMANDMRQLCKWQHSTNLVAEYKNRVLSELVAEQNKKAADNASI